MEDIDQDLYARDQPAQLRELADFAESVDAHTKASMLRAFAYTMELYAPVVKGLIEVREGDFSRERLEDAIQKWDDYYHQDGYSSRVEQAFKERGPSAHGSSDKE